MTPEQWEAVSRFSAECNLRITNQPAGDAATAGTMTIVFSTSNECIQHLLDASLAEDDD